jgi:immunoglobulin-binding protein 1
VDSVVLFFGHSCSRERNMQPLQPFTILPSGAGGDHRTRLREQVFQPDHRLPTMSIDEYLEIERQRGNILTGGG